ncbi:MAG: MFS transporter [Deltaproteobacteria bacterium]|nr:MAG: MFS transporter [Deltaproteobacteria bacterium]
MKNQQQSLAASLFQNRLWCKLFAAQVISLAGSGVTTVALALLAWHLAEGNAGEVLGLALALKMIASVTIAPLAGSVVRRVPRRRWLIVLDLLRAGLVLLLAFVTEIWQIYLLIFLMSSLSAGFTPVYQAVVADIVSEKELYTKALSFSRIAYDLEQLLSPALAALLLSVMGFSWLFLFDSLSFLLSALFLFWAVIPCAASSTPDNFFANLKFGLSAYLKTPRLRALLCLYVAVASASALMITGTVVYVSEILGRGEGSTAVALAVSGCGSMVVALLLPGILEKISIVRSFAVGIICLCIGLGFASFLPGWVLFLFLWFILGAGLTCIQLPAGLLVRMSSHPDDLASYFSANFSLSHLCWLVAYPVSGFLGVHLGMGGTFLLMAAVVFVSGAVAWRIYPQPDLLEIAHGHTAFVHSHVHDHEDRHHQHIHTDSTDEGHSLIHRHEEIRHCHAFTIDFHHPYWPRD